MAGTPSAVRASVRCPMEILIILLVVFIASKYIK
jgi:hypothetical protein